MKDKRFLVGCIIGLVGARLMTPFTWSGALVFVAIYFVTRMTVDKLTEG